MKLIDKILDRYFAHPILLDGMLSTAVWVVSKNFAWFKFKFADKAAQQNVLSNLISTDVSLAGFILAALTIIVTFKSNLRAKNIEEADNAQELIFSSKHYDSIVKVFRKSIIELVLCFILLYTMWLCSENLSIAAIHRVNTLGVLITSLTIGRSLFILFMILDLSKYKKE